MRIEIADLTFETIIGILEHERVQKQRIVVECTIDYDVRSGFINYADVAEQIRQIIIKGEFELLEDALESLQRQLKGAHSAIDILTIKLTKPDILPDCNVSVSETYKF